MKASVHGKGKGMGRVSGSRARVQGGLGAKGEGRGGLRVKGEKRGSRVKDIPCTLPPRN